MNFAGCWQRAVLCAAAALLLGSWGLAQDPGEPKDKEKPKEKVKTAAQKEFDKQANAAIDKGVKYLRGLLGAVGGEGLQPKGVAPLVGLALLEADVPPEDATIRKVANFVRTAAIQDSYNYSVCTSIMFLDRLGD